MEWLATVLPTVRRRRDDAWPESIYRQQQFLLSGARRPADLVSNTGRVSLAAVVLRIAEKVARHVGAGNSARSWGAR